MKPLHWYQIRTFAITFATYAILTLARQPYSITKSTLNPEEEHPKGDGWAPFNGKDGSTLLGTLDTVFLFAYSCGLFFSGSLGDRLNIRYFLGAGVIAVGVFVGLYGLAEDFEIHNYAYFIFCNIFAGLAQSIGWPSCVTVMARWIPTTARATIMGIWNAHSSVGYITGKLIATSSMEAWGWGAAFEVSALCCLFMGVLIILFLVPHPSEVGLSTAPDTVDLASIQNEDGVVEVEDPLAEKPGLLDENPLDSHKAISFMGALRIPGVISYSLALLFTKLVAYAFMFWLPFYLTSLDYSPQKAGNMSTAYDAGGIVGGIVAGWLADRYRTPGMVSMAMQIICAPLMYIFMAFGGSSFGAAIVIMFFIGLIIGGPYTLISSAVCADLAEHPDLKGNPRAMSTVAGIIDGTGSIGAAIQGVTIGYLSDALGWSSVFYMLIVMTVIGACCLIRVVMREWAQKQATKVDEGYVTLNEPTNGGDLDVETVIV